VTLATNDCYATGALVLAHSIRSHGTSRKLCVLVTPGVSPTVRETLQGAFDQVQMVDLLNSNDTERLLMLKRPELGVTFTKLHCWRQTQYSKCVFLDADTLALQSLDDLFGHPELTACCDIGWPDCFNSGMFVFVPSDNTFNRLMELAAKDGSFDGGDQGLLNQAFPDWHRVSFTYNMVASATYTYLPAFQKYGHDVKLVHFLGKTKPWHGEAVTSKNVTYDSYVRAWWTIYRNLVKPNVPEEAHHVPGAPSQPQRVYHHGQTREWQSTRQKVFQLSQKLAAVSMEDDLTTARARWESGNPDYTGADSFDKILNYINKQVGKEE